LLQKSSCAAFSSMYYPEASHAFAISAGWRIAHAKTCSHFVVFSFTSHSQQATHFPRTGTVGSAHCAKVPCISSSDFLLRRCFFLKPQWHVLMTAPDRPLKLANPPRIHPCSLQVCSDAASRSKTLCNHPRPSGFPCLSNRSFPAHYSSGAALFNNHAASEPIENP
jgi:hypothetical protein